MKLSTYGCKNVGISFEGRVIQKIMQITSRQTVGDQSAITLQMVADQVPSMFDNQSASNWQLVVDHSATGRQTVGDRLRTKILVGNWLLIVADGCRLRLVGDWLSL